MKAFLKENLKSVIIYLSFSILIIGLVVFNITRCVIENRSNGTTVIDGQTFIDMINDKEDFTLVLGQENCSACKAFNKTLREYTSEGNTVYYLYADNDNDVAITEALKIIKSKLSSELPVDKRVDSLKTPTTIYIKDGVFRDVYIGLAELADTEEYEKFVAVASGKNIVDDNGNELPTKIILSEEEFLEMLENEETFTITFGRTTCTHCIAFEETISKYVEDGNTLYYLYVDSDLISVDTSNLIYVKIYNELPSDRGAIRQYECIINGQVEMCEGWGTPTTIYVENGIFTDAFVGYISHESQYYDIFVDIIQGVYKNQPYPIA